MSSTWPALPRREPDRPAGREPGPIPVWLFGLAAAFVTIVGLSYGDDTWLAGDAILALTFMLDRRRVRLQQVHLVRLRLLQSTRPVRYRTRVQLDSNSGIIELVSHVPMAVGAHVSVESDGVIGVLGPYGKAIGVVVSQQAELPWD